MNESNGKEGWGRREGGGGDIGLISGAIHQMFKGVSIMSTGGLITHHHSHK